MADAMAGPRIAYGPRAAAFEGKLAEMLDVPHALAVQSGTAALHLALILAGVGRGDEVLMPSLTYIAPGNAVRYVGAHPVFVDVDPDFRQIDVERAEKFVETAYLEVGGELRNIATGRRLKAVLAIDLLGHPCDIDAVLEFGERLGLVVIDDAAEALGATVRSRPVGSRTRFSVLSFNANKLITTGGGGMLICRDVEDAKRAALLSRHGRVESEASDEEGTEPQQYQYAEIGFNYLMGEGQAALGLSQLRRIEIFLSRKREIAEGYARAFAREPRLTVPRQAPWALSSCWMYTIHVPAGARARIARSLALEGIQTRPIFTPLHQVASHEAEQSDDCHVAERFGETGLSLPCSTNLEDEQLGEVAAAVIEALATEA